MLKTREIVIPRSLVWRKPGGVNVPSGLELELGEEGQKVIYALSAEAGVLTVVM